MNLKNKTPMPPLGAHNYQQINGLIKTLLAPDNTVRYGEDT